MLLEIFLDATEDTSFISTFFSDFDAFPTFVQHFLSIIGATIIFFGGLYGVIQILVQLFGSQSLGVVDSDQIRLKLGKTIILGLEFIVASDVVGTTLTPDYYSLGMLGILVVVRTILNYTLDKDIQTLGQKSANKLLSSNKKWTNDEEW